MPIYNTVRLAQVRSIVWRDFFFLFINARGSGGISILAEQNNVHAGISIVLGWLAVTGIVVRCMGVTSSTWASVEPLLDKHWECRSHKLGEQVGQAKNKGLA